jgi:hypothetical protein
MNEEQQLRIVIGAITVVLIYIVIKAHRKRKGAPPEKLVEPSERSSRFHNLGRRLGVACRNLFKKHASDK